MNKIAYAGAPAPGGRPPAKSRNKANSACLQPRRARQFEVIERYKDRLPRDWYNILVASTRCDYAQMVRTLDIPKGTVKSRLNRARNALDRLVEADHQRSHALTQSALPTTDG